MQFTEEDRQILQEMVNSPITINQIAAALNETVYSINGAEVTAEHVLNIGSQGVFGRVDE